MTDFARRLRLHVQNYAGERPAFQIDDAMWAAAAGRHEALAAGLDVSIGGTDEEYRRVLPEAEILITWTSTLRGGLPVPAPKLKIAFVTSAGLDRLAPFDWLPPGVALLNNSGVHAEKAGEWGLMAILMVINNLPRFATAQREKRWDKTFNGIAVGQTVVIVGLGDIGGTVAMRAKQAGLKVIGVRARPAPHPHCDEVVGVDRIDDVLPRADVLLLAMPLTPQTNGLMSRERLARLKPGAGFVNMARGAAVDQDALCDALDAGRIANAVIDVMVPEPLPPESRVWSTRNLLLAPHVSCDDPATYTPRSLDVFFANLALWRRGEKMPNAIDVSRWY